MNKIPFSLTYSALKMFGRQLYSNAWAALSELVANGFDAGADDVYLYIDMRDKKHSKIELIDNGSGMDEDDLREKYVKIGRNRRIYDTKDNATGRKGIGKLAALYLSDRYSIISKKDNKITAWETDVTDLSDDITPELNQIENLGDISIICKDIWEEKTRNSGTIIKLDDVNLFRLGEAALEALKHKLTNYFLYDSMSKNLNVCFINSDSDKYNFKKLHKEIAYDNMASIFCSDNSIVKCNKSFYQLSFFDKSYKNNVIQLPRAIKPFPKSVQGPVSIRDKKNKAFFDLRGKALFYGIEKEYALMGWIGIHSTIEPEEAKSNDERYIKNQFYNPNQIRIYVRNKLANENIIPKLGFTAQYANYLEGEVSFDILDDNDFDDIATANRQDFSIVDERVDLLLKLIRGIARQLLDERQKIADQINQKKEEKNAQIRAKEKAVFTKDLYDDLVSAKVPQDVANSISPIIGNKLKGGYELKTSYKIFISHASKDRIFTDFVAYYLKSKGFKLTNEPSTTDIFYSTDGLDINSLVPLSKTIKEMIIDSNTDVLFFTSKNFLNSQYCLFEGGATWATRSRPGYSIISIDYDSIPVFLTNGKPEFSFDSKDKNSFNLNAQNYKNIVVILNRLIRHLNNNNRLRGQKEVPEIEFVEIPDRVQMSKEGKVINDYFDNEVQEYWNKYVIEQIDQYLEQDAKE